MISENLFEQFANFSPRCSENLTKPDCRSIVAFVSPMTALSVALLAAGTIGTALAQRPIHDPMTLMDRNFLPRVVSYYVSTALLD